MSWLRSKKASVTNLKAEESANRSTTPTPSNPDGKTEKRTFRSGLLTIRVMGAEGVNLPSGTAMPPAVQSALTSQQAKVAASVSPSSVNQQRLANRSKGSRYVSLVVIAQCTIFMPSLFCHLLLAIRDSIQRAQCWWLPYLVMEYEVNQVLITPLGGDLEKPLYMYQAHLWVTRPLYQKYID